MNLNDLKERAISGGALGREEIESLVTAPLDVLLTMANEIRIAVCGDKFDLCSIVNAKSGRCPEDCKYCAQSIHHMTSIEEYPLLTLECFLEIARRDFQAGILRFSFVTSGRNLDTNEVDLLCRAARLIRQEIPLSLCVSGGLLRDDDFFRLHQAGISRYHHNLETSRRHFPNICSTHTYDDKLNTLRAARQAGLECCCGLIVGLGETWSDRIDLAMELRRLKIRSVPINRLTPIPGTRLESFPIPEEEVLLRTVALFRFVLPNAAIRLAGGRRFSPDAGRRFFTGGGNACITGDMLTTTGVCVKKDLQIIKELGFHPERIL